MCYLWHHLVNLLHGQGLEHLHHLLLCDISITVLVHQSECQFSFVLLRKWTILRIFPKSMNLIEEAFEILYQTWFVKATALCGVCLYTRSHFKCSTVYSLNYSNSLFIKKVACGGNSFKFFTLVALLKPITMTGCYLILYNTL